MSSTLNMQAFNLLTMNTFAERVRSAMEEAGHTQSSLARAVGVTRASISFWLNGQTKEITGDNLLKAASALNVSPVWLAIGKGPRKEASEADVAAPTARSLERSLAEDGWPRLVSREDYDALSGRDQFLLNELVTTFVSACLQRRMPSQQGNEETPSVTGVIGAKRKRNTDTARTGTEQ